MLTAVLCLVLFVIFFVKYLEHRRYEQKLSKWTSPKGHWLLGHVPAFKTLESIIPTMHKYHKECKGIVRLKLGFRTRISFSDYNLVDLILSSNKLFAKSNDYEILTNWLENGLLTSSGTYWQHRRKLLTPAFHFQVLEQVIDVFNRAQETLIEKMKDECEKQDYIEVSKLFSSYTLDIISESAMGIKINAQKNDKCEYSTSVRGIRTIVVERIFSLYKRNNFLYKFTETHKREQKSVKNMHDTAMWVIKEKKAQLKDNNNNEDLVDDDGYAKKKKMAFLDLLLSATYNGKPLSNKALREEVNTFMFAGHDTTASAMSFALFNLAKHPEIQDKLFEEQQKIFEADINANVTYADLHNMHYLEMCVKESMRLNPPVPTFSKVVQEDIEYDGKVLPKGLVVSIFVPGVHRNPEFWPEPDKFDPERFSKNNKLKRAPYAFIPFSAGARNCIGQKFALLEIKATLSKIIRTFKISEKPGFVPMLTPEIALQSKNGVYVKLEPRT